MQPSRLFRMFGVAALAAALHVPAAAQSATSHPLPAPADSVRARVLDQVKVPEGFDATAFAVPPVAMYPACLEAAPTGELFMCLDPNLSLDRDKGKGKVLRLVDQNNDGVADRYTVFVDSIDSPRGLVWDGTTLYVMHPPTLSAFRDTNGDGVADQSEVLVRGLGFDLDFRGADHTTNGITMGIDGWLYVAVGDYGFVKATGRDGTQLQLRGGGVVRVRPDGSEMEIYARGTRNIYDVAVDPFLNVFTRDNTNDGEGWNLRLEYLPQGSNLGYPSLFMNFEEEVLPPLADLGAGSGTAGLWIQDPNFPGEYGNALYTGDWTLNKIYRQPLRPKGAFFEIGNEEFMTIPHPSDMVMDGSSNLYVASLAGGSFTYVGDNVGYIVRVSPSGRRAARFGGVAGLNASRLVDLVVSPNAVHRLAAQRELLRRGAQDATVRRLEQLVLNQQQPAFARVAAMFTLKQLIGARSHAVIERVAAEPALRAVALRALTDRRSQLTGLSSSLFVRALSDADPRVQMHAVTALERLGAREAAADILPLAASSDPALSHVATNALVELRARDAALRALDSGSPQVAAAALRVLQRLHDPVTVGALLERAGRASDAATKRQHLRALARLYNRDAIWSGDWWTTKPNRDGPYFEPAAWEESARIRPVLTQALLSASGEEFSALAGDLTRNRVLPKGADSLLVALARTRDPQRAEVITGLVGRKTVDPDLIPQLSALSRKSPALRDAVLEMLVAQSSVNDESLPMVRAAALDRSLAPELRTRALTALGTRQGPSAAADLAATYAQLTPELADQEELQQAWRRFAGDRRNIAQLDHYVAMTRSSDENQRILGYAVLVQIARVPRNPEAARNQATAVIDAAWADRSATPNLVQAIELMNAESVYAERLQAFRAGAQK